MYLVDEPSPKSGYNNVGIIRVETGGRGGEVGEKKEGGGREKLYFSTTTTGLEGGGRGGIEDGIRGQGPFLFE